MCACHLLARLRFKLFILLLVITAASIAVVASVEVEKRMQNKMEKIGNKKKHTKMSASQISYGDGVVGDDGVE